MAPASLLSPEGEEIPSREDFRSPSNIRNPSLSWSQTAMGQQNLVTDRTGYFLFFRARYLYG